MSICGVCASVHGCVQVCVWVCVGVAGMHMRVWACAGMHGCTRVFAGVYLCGQVCVWCGWVRECVCVHRCALVCAVVREFSEFLLENRVLTSADFNTYPIRIFIN